MEQLLRLLKTIPEYRTLTDSLAEGRNAAVTGIGQINRSHLIAGLTRDFKSPIVILCQDDMAARRLQEELKGFLGIMVPILPGRDLTMYDAAVVSRSWEQKRLRQLYDLAAGKTPVQIMSWESMSQRTMPPAVLKEADASQASDLYEPLRPQCAAAERLLQHPAPTDDCHVRRYFSGTGTASRPGRRLCRRSQRHQVYHSGSRLPGFPPGENRCGGQAQSGI